MNPAVDPIDAMIERAKLTPYIHLPGYMERYYLVPPTEPGGAGVRLHHILRSDADRHRHDHPFDFTTVLLRGHYVEDTPQGRRAHAEGAVLHRKAEDLHQLVLPEGRTVWTLFIHGPRRKEWGFNVDGTWVKWTDYLDKDGVVLQEYASKGLL